MIAFLGSPIEVHLNISLRGREYPIDGAGFVVSSRISSGYPAGGNACDLFSKNTSWGALYHSGENCDQVVLFSEGIDEFAFK